MGNRKRGVRSMFFIKALSKMKLLELEQNKIAKKILNLYSVWWKCYGDKFKKNKDYPLLQREYAEKSQLKKMCDNKFIPYIEITPLYRKASGGLLFVNCNPSGTDYNYYKEKNSNTPTDCLYYEDSNNRYFKEVERFAKNVGGDDFENFAMIDVFPIVLQNQGYLKKAFTKSIKENNSGMGEAFKCLINIFLKIVVIIEPKIVVVTNAFVKNLITNDFKNLGLVEINADDENVCYNVKIKKKNGYFETTVFCGGMIAGGHQMDTESKKRLVRDVKRFFVK